MITDKLTSYVASKKDLLLGIEHRQHQGLNNRAENSHQPTRRRERQMKRFKSAGQAQRFPSAYDDIHNLVHLHRDHLPAEQYRTAWAEAIHTWAEITGVVGMAYLSACRFSSGASFCSRPIKLTVPQQQLVVRIVQGRMVQERDFTDGALVEVAKQ